MSKNHTQVRWYALLNDVVGGWAISTVKAESVAKLEQPIGAVIVAEFNDEIVCKYVVNLHNLHHNMRDAT